MILLPMDLTDLVEDVILNPWLAYGLVDADAMDAVPAPAPVVAAPASVPVVGVVVIAFPVPDPPLVPVDVAVAVTDPMIASRCSISFAAATVATPW